MLGSTPLEANLSLGGDLSASRRTAWFDLEGGRHFSLEMACPATGSPIGVWSVEVCNHGKAGVAGATIPSDQLKGLTQPSDGNAWSCFVDNVETTARFAAVVWTRTSGGIGADLTDGRGTTGARIVVKE